MRVLVSLFSRGGDCLEDLGGVSPRAVTLEFAVARNLVLEEILEWLIDQANLSANFRGPRVFVHFAVLASVLLENRPGSRLVRAFSALHVGLRRDARRE